DPVEPFFANGLPVRAAVGLLEATADAPARIVHLQQSGEDGSALRVGSLEEAGPVAFGAPLELAFRVPPVPVLFTAPSGEGFFVTQQRGGEYHSPTGPLQIVRGLPDAPRRVTTAVTPSSFVTTTDPD